MNPKVSRRNFLMKGAQVCVGCCALIALPKLSANGLSSGFLPDNEIPDPKKLNYCGYKCPDDCKFLAASINNDTALKKEAFDIWKIEEKYGIAFDPEKIFCFGCKTTDKPEGVIITNCTVRKCAVEKKIDCCIECKELTGCSKELWTQFPDFKKMVIEMQTKYFETRGA